MIIQSTEMAQVIPIGKKVEVTGCGCLGMFIENRIITINAYCIGKYEIIWELWRNVFHWAQDKYCFSCKGQAGGKYNEKTNDNDAVALGKGQPVTMISWEDIIIWCNAYSEYMGKNPVYWFDNEIIRNYKNSKNAEMRQGTNGYRLPTEAEWEFAARGGDPGSQDWQYKYAGSDNLNEVGWYSNNSDKMSHPVGKKRANRLGLYDMSGNVWEWCWDWNTGDIIKPGAETNPTGTGEGNPRIYRGGGWFNDESCSSVMVRHCTFPNRSYSAMGFRIAAWLDHRDVSI